jgi:hypothetical protein
MQNLTEDQINELRKALGIEEEITYIDRSMLTCTKGSFEEENDTDKCEEDYNMLKKKVKELEAKYGK